MGLEKLKEAVNVGTKFKVDGVELSVYKFTIEDLANYGEDIERMITSYKDGGLKDLIVKEIKTVSKIVALAIKESEEDIKLIGVDNLALIIIKIIEVNSNLFLEKIIPAMEGFTKKLDQLKK